MTIFNICIITAVIAIGIIIILVLDWIGEVKRDIARVSICKSNIPYEIGSINSDTAILASAINALTEGDKESAIAQCKKFNERWWVDTADGKRYRAGTCQISDKEEPDD